MKEFTLTSGVQKWEFNKMKINDNEKVIALGDFFTVEQAEETGIHSISSNNELTFRGIIKSGSSEIAGQEVGNTVICLKSAAIPVTKNLFLIHKEHILAVIGE